MYDIYSILEHHYFKIEKRKNPKFVVIDYFEGLQKYLPLPKGTRAGLKKTYTNSRGFRVKSTVLVNTLADVAKIRKLLSVPKSVSVTKISKKDYGSSRHREKFTLMHPDHNKPVVQAAVKEVKAEFIQPYAQEALNGELGLTSTDLAKSLGVQHKHVLEKIRRMTIEKILDLGLMAAKTAGNEFSLSTETAKFFVARWNNDLGSGYLKYLLSCENIVERAPALGAIISEAQIANIIAMTTAIMNKMIPQQIETTIKTEIVKIQPKIQLNTERHDGAMLSASQQAICQPLYTEQNLKHGCSIIHALIKKAAKIRFRPDAPSSDCTWHKIRQSDFEELVSFIKNYELSDLDRKRVEKFWATAAGKKDRERWQRKPSVLYPQEDT